MESLLPFATCFDVGVQLALMFGRKLGNTCFWQKNDSQLCAQWLCLNHGFTKTGKALQDHGIQQLTQHCHVHHPCPQVPLLIFERLPRWWLHHFPGKSLPMLYNPSSDFFFFFLICGLSTLCCSLRPFPFVLHPGQTEWSPILLWQQHLFFSAGLNLAFEQEWGHCFCPCSGVICAAAWPDKRCTGIFQWTMDSFITYLPHWQ